MTAGARVDRDGGVSVAVALAIVVGGGASSACGGRGNRGAAAVAGSGPTGIANCGGKSGLTAEGSTAQQNAIGAFKQA